VLETKSRNDWLSHRCYKGFICCLTMPEGRPTPIKAPEQLHQSSIKCGALLPLKRTLLFAGKLKYAVKTVWAWLYSSCCLQAGTMLYLATQYKLLAMVRFVDLLGTESFEYTVGANLGPLTFAVHAATAGKAASAATRLNPQDTAQADYSGSCSE
jgi:hypothetical protein